MEGFALSAHAAKIEFCCVVNLQDKEQGEIAYEYGYSYVFNYFFPDANLIIECIMLLAMLEFESI